MNADTIRGIREIEKRQWYRLSTTLGEGGWAAIRKFADNWKTYLLYLPDSAGPVEQIKAANDTTARRAFNSLYHLKDTGYTIFEKQSQYRELTD